MDNMSEMVSILTNVRTVAGMNTSTNINYGGVSGSILDVYGPGEYEWDFFPKFTVKFHSHRGRDDSLMIRWGKNMTIEVSIAYYSLIFQQPLSTQGRFRWCNCHPTTRFLLSLPIQEVRMKYRPLFARYI